MTRSLDNSKMMKLCPVEEQSQNRFDLRLLSGTRHAFQWTTLLRGSAYLFLLLCCLWTAPHFESRWASVTSAKNFRKIKLYNFAILCEVTKSLNPSVPQMGSCLYISSGFTSIASVYGWDIVEGKTGEIQLLFLHVISPHYLVYWLIRSWQDD